jgi:NADPH:quinone reductase-like Zn-dependent oxidoreductase
MRAIVVDKFGGPEVLRLDERFPEPPLAADGARIRVRASGVNPTDWKMREGWLAQTFPHVMPAIPGWELAGVVLEVGAGVTEWQPGDEVCAYARVSHVHYGTYAEQCVLPAGQIVRKPASVPFLEAGSIPLAGLTAMQLIEKANVRGTDTVVVQGAAGGVGHLALQLAKHRGARVIAVGRSDNHDFLRDLGADEVVDHTLGGVAEQVRHLAAGGVDAVISTVGVDPDQLEQLKGAEADGFRMSSIAISDLTTYGADAGYVAVRSNTEQLAHLLNLVAGGRLQVKLQEVFTLEKAAEAQELLRKGPVRGKLVLEI